MTPRFFTPEEARATLPALRPLLAQLRDAFHHYRFAREQVAELRTMYREDPADVEGHPAHAEALRWHREAEDRGAQVEAVLRDVRATGADVKDPLLGLVDFHHRRANGDVVLLCYRDDEDDLRYWHPVDTGFAGRRPLSEL
jgi:hypothetical protein